MARSAGESLKPRYHLIGLVIVLLVLWRLHSLLALPGGSGAFEPEAPMLAANDVQVEERPEALPAADSSDQAPDTPATASTVTFMGKPCLENDCSTDLAGYHWAEENGISDPSACPDPSGEFVAGCRLYAGIEQKYNI